MESKVKTLVIDLETTIKCPVGNHSANPMWAGNKVIAAGYKDVDADDVTIEYDASGVATDALLVTCSEAGMVVGHNVKFDLLYIYRNAKTPLPRIWDTQLAAYLLSGQRQLYASLDQLTAEYVGEHALKDDKMKEYWKAGVCTSEIPKSELCDYLWHDVDNTAQIFRKQFDEASNLDILPLMFTQMDALRATIEMNRNGMRVDWDYVVASKAKYDDILQEAISKVKSWHPDLDVYSPKQLSLFFFGGTEKYKEKERVGDYKNGNPKFKLVDKERTIKGLYEPFTEVGKSGYFSVDDATLKRLVDTDADPVAEQLLVIRETAKIADTYYQGLLDLRFPDQNIYPNLNHCATKTGRLSSTNPNLQNQTDTGDVKRAYVSRYTDGVILELDYSQLEMVALAYIADDKQLIDDINNGRDMHRELYRSMYGRMPTDKERKPFKRFSFLLVYGGGATTLMAQSGCDRATAQKFIKTFYTRYKGVKKYHEEIVKQANDKAVVEYSETKTGPQYTYYHASPTGRHYVFNKYHNEYKGDMTFSPTELKNWPIQGFATGDIVPMMVGILLRNLEDAKLVDKGACLVMTVHDSVVLDTPKEIAYSVAKLAKETLENAPMYMKQFFGIDFPCKLGVGVEAGSNWQDKEEINLKEIV